MDRLSNPVPGEMRQNDLSCVSGGPLRDIETCDPISCGCGPRDAIPTQVKINSANQHETDGFFQHKSGSFGQIGCIPETWTHGRGSCDAELPSVVVSAPFQAFLCAGEAVPAVGKRDAIASRRRVRQPGQTGYGTVAVLDEYGAQTVGKVTTKDEASAFCSLLTPRGIVQIHHVRRRAFWTPISIALLHRRL
jgi:hypothetical protein